MNNLKRMYTDFWSRRFLLAAVLFLLFVLGGQVSRAFGQQSLIGEWYVRCCDETLGWTLSITKQEGVTFSGTFSSENAGGVLTNGLIRGNTIEFVRSGYWGTQRWTAQLVSGGGRLQMLNGIWTGYREDDYRGRNNWRAERVGGGGVSSGGVGSVWNESEVAGWRGLWTRIGSSNEFDAKFTAPSGVTITAKLRMEIDRRNVSIFRWNPGTWGICSYIGTFSPDFRAVAGLYQCTDQNGIWSAQYAWNATITP